MMATYDPHDTNADRNIPINTPTPLDGRVILVPYNPNWPAMYEAEASHIHTALGEKVLVLEHIGSTAVPGLIAKPCIDILLAVEDSANEDAYLPELDAAGFVLRLRHPNWNEHRAFKSERMNVNLHVWSANSPEVQRHIEFRDWLRTHDDDREAYAEAKRQISQQHHATMSDYANAKDAVVLSIQARIHAGTGDPE